MFIAQKLRKENIVEYLLYMWQVEDLIRAYDLSLTRIKREYVAQFDYDDQQRDEEIDWFGNLIRMMNQEGKRDGGHLQINEILANDLAEFHAQLLENPQFPVYAAQYYKVLPFIVELRGKSDREYGEIETCLNALYGVMTLRLQKKPITPQTQKAIDEITAFLGLLSDYYTIHNP